MVGFNENRGFIFRNGVVTPYLAAPVQGLPFAFTQLYGVNNAGRFVGEYFALGVDATGFIDNHGVLTTVAFPDDAVRTIPRDINNQGDVAGFYSNSQNRTVGFLLHQGQYQKIEIPGARFVTVLGLNDRRQVVGNYTLENDFNFTRRGFLWENGQVTFFDFPGAEQTEPCGIGEDGTIVGSYEKTFAGPFGPYVKKYAFLLRNGQFETINVPGQSVSYATGINRRGDISGWSASEEYSGATNPPVFTRIDGTAWILRR